MRDIDSIGKHAHCHCQHASVPLCSVPSSSPRAHLLLVCPSIPPLMDSTSHGSRSSTLRAPPPGGIHLILGPMFAGKTTALLKRVQVEISSGRRAALVKPDKDTRYGLSAVISHDGMHMPCWAVPSLEAFRCQIGDDAYAKLDVIGIDEAQFFEDLYNFCRAAADDEGKTIVVAGLDGDFLRKTFGSTLDLIPIADTVVKLSSRCNVCGSAAYFTYRKTDEQKTEVIGGADVYMPVCRQHYVNGLAEDTTVVVLHEMGGTLFNVAAESPITLL